MWEYSNMKCKGSCAPCQHGTKMVEDVESQDGAQKIGDISNKEKKTIKKNLVSYLFVYQNLFFNYLNKNFFFLVWKCNSVGKVSTM